MKDLLKKLTGVYSPVGFESAIREVIQTEIAPHVDSISVDALGNLHAVKNGSGAGKRIMLTAHMDEIGLMVTNVTAKGFIRFTNLGTLLPRNMPGSRVIFANGLTGVINIDGDLTSLKETPTLKNLYIDVGALSKDDCPLTVGDVAAFFGPFTDLGQRVVAKSLDDRAGCAVLVETAKRLKTSPHEVHFLFAVQEEFWHQGAITGTYRIQPDIALALDVTPTGDVPEVKNYPVSLGKGPAIKVMDKGNISHPAVKNWLIETAQAQNIPYQIEALTVGGTDARAVQVSRGGVAVGTLSIPCRHVHTPSEMVDMNDMAQAVDLLCAVLTQPVPEALR